MPSVSQAQQRAMHAAASGHSTLGIPQSVGQDFANADAARGPAKLPKVAPVAKPPKVQPPKSGLQNLHAILRALRVPKIP